MPEAGHNGIDATVLARWTGEILAIHDKLDEQKIENMNKCKEIREPLPDLYEAAFNAGLPKKAFRAHIKLELAKRRYETFCENVIPDDEDDRASYEALRAVAEAGDLFDHAVKKHDAASDDEQKDLRPRHLKELDRQRAEENARRLREGISGLPGADATEA